MGNVSTSRNVLTGAIETLHKVKSDTSYFDKACKVTKHTVAAADNAAKLAGKTVAYAPLAALGKCAGGFCVVAGAFNIINRLFEFVVPGKKNFNTSNDFSWKSWKKNKTEDVKYAWMKDSWRPKGSSLSKSEKEADIARLRRNTFQDDGYWTGMKTTAQLGLTAAHTISFVEFFNMIGVFALGAAAPILSLVKNVIYIPSGALSVADSSYKINRAAKYISNCNDKKIKWMNKGQYNGETIQEKCQTKMEVIQNKIALLRDRMDLPHISEGEVNDIESFINKKELKMRRLELYIKEAESSKDAPLNEESQWAKDCAFKVDAWAKNVFVAKKNAKVEITKNSLNIVYNVGKVALGIIGLVGLFTGIAFNPIFLLSISIAWAAIEAIGLSKEVYGFFNSSKHISKPQLPPLPSLAVTAS